METFIAMTIVALIGAVVDMITTTQTNASNSAAALQNRLAQKEENALNREFNAEEAQKDRDFQEQMANTDVIRQFKQYEQLGVNPLMAVVGGSGSPVPSGASASYGTGLSGSLPNMIKSMAGPQISGLSSQVVQAQLLQAQKNNIEADTLLKNTEAAKKSTEASGVELDNEFKRRVMDSKVEAQKLANQLTRDQSRDLNNQIDKRAKEMDLLVKQASTEDERKKYFESAAILNKANAYKVTVMIPYEQALAEAKTAAEKAVAGLSSVNAAYQQGLIDNGYIDNLCDKVASEAGIAKDSKDMADLKTMIRTGEFWKDDKGVTKFLGEHLITPLAVVLDNFNPIKDALSGLVK